MQNHRVRLTSPVATSYFATRAANSLDIDVERKATHELSIDADLVSPFNVGLVVGASGSGKTTFADAVWGDGHRREVLDPSRPVIDQFPDAFDYDARSAALCAIGLSQVTCWIRPAFTLSNGQRARAEAALRMAQAGDEVVVIDEWTSVVDRTVAAAMSLCVARFARKFGKRVVLLSCHYDVDEWLQPDWVVDCNLSAFVDGRSLRRPRTRTLTFDVAECSPASWRYFARYHYLSDRMPGGYVRTFGVWHEGRQIGFQCFANYVPRRRFEPMQLHSNRTVIHPDYVGFGLGGLVINETSRIIAGEGFVVGAKFSSVPIYRMFAKRPDLWRLTAVARNVAKPGAGIRQTGFRDDVKTWSFRWIGGT